MGDSMHLVKMDGAELQGDGREDGGECREVDNLLVGRNCRKRGGKTMEKMALEAGVEWPFFFFFLEASMACSRHRGDAWPKAKKNRPSVAYPRFQGPIPGGEPLSEAFAPRPRWRGHSCPTAASHGPCRRSEADGLAVDIWADLFSLSLSLSPPLAPSLLLHDARQPVCMAKAGEAAGRRPRTVAPPPSPPAASPAMRAGR